MRSLRFFLAGSALAFLSACGGLVDIPGPTQGAPPASGGAGSGAADEPGAPAPAPPLPPTAGLVADVTTPPLAALPVTSVERAVRCRRVPGDEISATMTDSVWGVDGAGHQEIAGGRRLLGEHSLNRALGVVGDDVFVETYSFVGDVFRFGIVRVSLNDHVASEVAPLAAGAHMRSVATLGSAIWGLRGADLLRIDAGGVAVVASDAGATSDLVRRTAGLVVVDGPGPRRLVTAAGQVLPLSAVQVPSASSREDWDVHADGTVVYAVDRRIRRSDRPGVLVTANAEISSLRVDAVTGAVAFAVSRPAPDLTSLFVVDGAGVRHVLAAKKHLSQPSEPPFRIFAAFEGVLSVATSCSDDEDAPGLMPVHVDAAVGRVEYVVDDPAYPYVADVGRMLDQGLFHGADAWTPLPTPRFFVRR